MERNDFDTLDGSPTTPGGPEGRLLAGRYKIIRKLGEGGMGMVYLAEDAELDNAKVAIKFIPPTLAGNPRAVKGLVKEAQIARKLSHPNIVRLHDLHTDGHQKFLVMEYIEGKTLEELLTEKDNERLTLEELLPIAQQVAAGLDYAHSLVPPVLHRDLKPSNIMIDNHGVAKLLDFGIAREMKDSYTCVTGQETSGTLPYMSPEQLNGDAPAAAMDIYSFGALLYECLSGHAPFYTGDIRHQIINKTAPAIPDVCEDVNAALQSALAKSVADRPATAGELSARLEAPQPVGRETSHSAQRLADSVRRPDRAIAPPASRRMSFGDLADILEDARHFLEAKSWKTSPILKPRDRYLHIQACRPEWPSTVGGIHYEARVTEEYLRRGIIDLNLHIEGDTPDRDAVCSRIRELLKPYERQILAMCGVRLSDESIEEILKGELPLAGLTARSLAETIEKMTMTESFVDEARYLAGKDQVYRTDFLGKGRQPAIKFHGKTGGWKFCSSGGRFNTPCLMCSGEAFNWFDSEDTNILILHPDYGFRDFANGEQAYISAVVRAPRGGQLQLVAQACASDEQWITIFDENPLLPETDLWQLVTAEGKLKAPKGYNFAKDGLFPYILVTAPGKDVWFASVEIGRCE